MDFEESKVSSSRIILVCLLALCDLSLWGRRVGLGLSSEVIVTVFVLVRVVVVDIRCYSLRNDQGWILMAGKVFCSVFGGSCCFSSSSWSFWFDRAYKKEIAALEERLYRSSYVYFRQLLISMNSYFLRNSQALISISEI